MLSRLAEVNAQMVDVLYSAALGLIAGLVPVYLGLIPLPLFRRFSASRQNLVISFSVGILLFLFADVTEQAVGLSDKTAIGSLLFTVGLVVGLGVPYLISSRRQSTGEDSATSGRKSAAKFFTAYVISIGIGLHNLGEGLAIGASYAAGQLGLTAVLVIGFALHNGTEGVAISGPISDVPIRTREPLLLGFLAGFPTIVGSIIGSVAYSDLLGSLFSSTAAGALLYVAVELTRRAHPHRTTFIGILLGVLVMYFTDLLLTI